MPTIKEAKIKIESRIENLDEAGMSIGDVERAVTECEGFYYVCPPDFKITYTERGEGGEVSCEIVRSGDSLTVKRQGAIESTLVFRKGEEYSGIYSVVPYKFDITVSTRRLDVSLDDMGGSIDLLYNMSIGGADKAVRMKIWIQTS